MPVDIAVTFPQLTKLIQEGKLKSKLEEIEPAYRCVQTAHFVPQENQISGFWRAVATAAFEADTNRLETAFFRLRLIEQGLEQASRCGKQGNFRDRLFKDISNFQQCLAELYLLGRLGPLADSVDIELPGSGSNKNYDLHLEIAGVEIHIDCKWRTATPLGEVSVDTIFDIQSILGTSFDSDCLVVLRHNHINSEDQKLEIACVVDEARRTINGERGSAAQLDLDNIEQHLDNIRGNTLTCGIYELLMGEEVVAFNIANSQAAYIPAKRTLYLDHDLIDHIEFINLVIDGDRRGCCCLVPNPESQAVISRAIQEDWGISSPAVECDVVHPEHLRIKNLVSEVYLQLPANPINIVCVGVEDDSYFGDVESALRGEPVPDPNAQSGIGLKGGLFDDPSFNSISGVIAFTLNSGMVPSKKSHYWINDRCIHLLPEYLVKSLCEALA